MRNVTERGSETRLPSARLGPDCSATDLTASVILRGEVWWSHVSTPAEMARHSRGMSHELWVPTRTNEGGDGQQTGQDAPDCLSDSGRRLSSVMLSWGHSGRRACVIGIVPRGSAAQH